MAKIAMVDQDGVVCNKQYQTTKDIRTLVHSVTKNNLVIVPNSDTPVERLQANFRLMLGYSAQVVVGEKGAVVHVNCETIFPTPVLGIENFISELKVFSESVQIDFLVGDSATWIRNGRTFTPNRSIIIFDSLRQQTIGFCLRQTDKIGIAHINSFWGNMVFSAIQGITLPKGLDSFDYNPDYGIAISNGVGVTKTDGYNVLRSFYPDTQFFMVGDGIIDVIDDSRVIHCAVDNAHDILKERATFISQYPFTHGLEECLEWIAGYNE